MDLPKKGSFAQARKNSNPEPNPMDDPSKWSRLQKGLFEKEFSFCSSTSSKSQSDIGEDLAPDEVPQATSSNYARAQAKIKELYQRAETAEMNLKEEIKLRIHLVNHLKVLGFKSLQMVASYGTQYLGIPSSQSSLFYFLQPKFPTGRLTKIDCLLTPKPASKRQQSSATSAPQAKPTAEPSLCRPPGLIERNTFCGNFLFTNPIPSRSMPSTHGNENNWSLTPTSIYGICPNSELSRIGFTTWFAQLQKTLESSQSGLSFSGALGNCTILDTAPETCASKYGFPIKGPKQVNPFELPAGFPGSQALSDLPGSLTVPPWGTGPTSLTLFPAYSTAITPAAFNAKNAGGSSVATGTGAAATGARTGSATEIGAGSPTATIKGSGAAISTGNTG
ncbi:hypothetical protein BKA65DRAFT_475466 [Rhexocercosporidium sp. MPI-PUGE-AT-0058]|nr:hypothetical protein BKA65DRAFT_475466 [Rhexocercosporidium sp. MPI-PUGE-AT-0058]